MLERFGIRLVPRPAAPAYVVFLISLGAILAAIIVTGFIFWAYGVNPFSAYATIAERTLFNGRGFSEVVRKSVPLLLAGVGLVLAFRAPFWNIGAEGQILAGAVGASGVALFVPLPPPLAIPAMFLAGFIAGALWGFLPAILKIRLRRQRDHHHPDDELYRPLHRALADQRALEGGERRRLLLQRSVRPGDLAADDRHHPAPLAHAPARPAPGCLHRLPHQPDAAPDSKFA